MKPALLQQALDALEHHREFNEHHVDIEAAIATLRAALAQPTPVPDDAALNTLARLFHSGEEIEGDDGAAMMVDMTLWNEGCEALESLIGRGDHETLASPAARAVREPSRQHNWQPYGIGFKCDACGMFSHSGQENACIGIAGGPRIG